MSMFMVNGAEGFDEYMKWEERQQAAVEAALAPEQRAITWGDYFMRVWQMPSMTGEGSMIAIFGRVYLWEELVEKEDEETLAGMKEREKRFLFCHCYSVIEPLGEIGDVNRWEMWPISREQFLLAELSGWDPLHPDVWSWFRQKGHDLTTKRGVIPEEKPPGYIG